MEIKQAQLPVTLMSPGMDEDTGKTANNAPVPQDASASDAGDGGVATGEALFNAARNLHDAQTARYQAYTQVNEEVKRSLGGNEGEAGIDGKQLDALLDALAGAALSEKLDGAREEDAGKAFLNLLSGADDAVDDSADRGNDAIEGGKQDAPRIFSRSMPPPYGMVDNGKDSETSSNNLGDIWKELAGLIGQSKDGDLDKFSSALEKYTKLYQELADIQAKFGQWVRGDDDNYMKVDFASLKEALTNLLNKYDNPGKDQIIAGDSSNGLTEDEAKAICEKLGLDPKACNHRNSDGTYCVIPDMSQVRKMVESLPSGNNDHKISIASYNAWKAGFDSQMSRVEDAMQTRGQKYSNTYSRFENFHKTISSIIQSMADMLRQFLQF